MTTLSSVRVAEILETDDATLYFSTATVHLQYPSLTFRLVLSLHFKNQRLTVCLVIKFILLEF